MTTLIGKSERKTCISAAGLVKSYGGLEVLHGVSFDARERDVLSVLGASGSGKSTMLRCLNLLEVPDAGEITIGDNKVILHRGRSDRVAVDPAQVSRIRRSTAMVFQSFNLWSHMTVLQNVIEGPVYVQRRSKKECIEEAEHFLSRVGVSEKRDMYPAQLSGGQQQRVAIARALAMHPQVLLFDEPTSALDPELVGEVLQIMRSLAAEGRTMIVVTHEMGFARDVSSKVMFLHAGKVEETGTPREIFETPQSAHLKRFLNY